MPRQPLQQACKPIPVAKIYWCLVMGRNLVGVPDLATSKKMPKSRDNRGEESDASAWANLHPPPSHPHMPSQNPSSGLPSSAANYPGATVVRPAPNIPATPSKRIVLPAPGISVSATGGAECIDGCNTVTPPERISPSAMMTPDPEKTYSHDPMMPAEIVPSEELRFDSREDAYNFYCYYARMAGFDVRITKTHLIVGEFSCNKQGKCEFYKPGEERKKDKTSMRTTCKAFVKAKWTKRKGYWFFDRIIMEHNHILTPSPEAVQFRMPTRIKIQLSWRWLINGTATMSLPIVL
ncbi:hypothetical protein PR202_gb07158 [Eleusine coracana subsp. coracana]|uniref:FAR1 domain-containing protein n=1 Tax=Eleusine coracana subsp. coracana TaxID=191504 RepID=A0AAV5EBJ9_ELECO|nr:hypothetical protein PR202_gb07158 [Eleusine coracana subsp. coracana]